MGQRCTWTSELASVWHCQLSIAALLLIAALVAGGVPPHGEGLQIPDPGTMFNVQGRRFWNKSLGLDQLPHGVLGHQCSTARPDPHPDHTLTYTPNRRRGPDPDREGDVHFGPSKMKMHKHLEPLDPHVDTMALHDALQQAMHVHALCAVP